MVFSFYFLFFDGRVKRVKTRLRPRLRLVFNTGTRHTTTVGLYIPLNCTSLISRGQGLGSFVPQANQSFMYTCILDICTATPTAAQVLYSVHMRGAERLRGA